MSHSPRPRRPGVAIVVLAALAMTGCGSDEPAAVCSSIDALEASVAAVTTVDLERGTLTQVRDNVAQVQSDLGAVREDAAEEYASEVDAVARAADSVGTSVRDALSSPSSQAITEIGGDVEQLGTSLSTLEDAVASTC